MNALKKPIGIAAVLVFGILFAGIASATIVMNFDDMPNAQNGELVGNFYNGGCGTSYNGGPVDCNGPNYGVVWTGGAVAGGAPNGLFGNTSNEPSGPNVMGPVAGFGADSFMNVAAGFDTGFSFYYTAARQGGTVTVYSGLDGAGTVLATLNLPVTGALCDGQTDFSCWDPFGVTFAGTAMSANFAGVEGQIVFDNITLGSGTPGGTPVPEPAVLGMFGLGVLLIGLFVGLRRRFV